MSLIAFVIIVAILGLVVYLVETYIPMSPPFKLVIRVVVVLVVILWLLQIIGITGPMIPRVR